MLALITIVLAITASIQGRKFNNPILDNGDFPDPGTIKVNGTYYIVTTTNNNLPEKFPIHTSTDLINWTLSGYIFDETNLPSWSNKDQAFWAPEIHKIDNMYHVYFSAGDVPNNRITIGVAMAPHPLGPYMALDRTLLPDPEGGIDSTVINDNGTLYLAWRDGDYIKALPMNPDGISFPTTQVTNLLRHELPWEDDTVEGPWYIRRGEYHYLLYSGHGMCSELYRVGVARSRNPLGPYEKRGDPILASNDFFQGPGHNSMVKDLDDESDLIVFHAWKKDQVCGEDWTRLTLLASVGWDSDGWPYVYDF